MSPLPPSALQPAGSADACTEAAAQPAIELARGGVAPLEAIAPVAIGPGRSNVDPMDAVSRLAAFRPTWADLQWICSAFAGYVTADFAVPVERCLHLPKTYEGTRKARRNRWLCEAARHIDETRPGPGSKRLQEAWDAFLSRGPWNAWRGDSEPPEGASALNTALFHASVHNRGESLVARSIEREVRHIFAEKCRAKTHIV